MCGATCFDTTCGEPDVNRAAGRVSSWDFTSFKHGCSRTSINSRSCSHREGEESKSRSSCDGVLEKLGPFTRKDVTRFLQVFDAEMLHRNIPADLKKSNFHRVVAADVLPIMEGLQTQDVEWDAFYSVFSIMLIPPR